MEVLSNSGESNVVVEDFASEFSELMENDIILALENNAEQQLTGDHLCSY